MSDPARGRLLPELRGQSVDVHLEVFIFAVGPDHGFDELAHRTEGLALPDADPESMILGGRVNRQSDVGGKALPAQPRSILTISSFASGWSWRPAGRAKAARSSGGGRESGAGEGTNRRNLALFAGAVTLRGLECENRSMALSA